MTPRNPTHSPQMQLQTLTKSPPDSKRTIQEWQNSRFTHRSADFNDDGGCTVLRLRCHTSASGHAQPRELARRAVPHATGAAALLQSSHCEIPQDDPSYSRPCIPLISHSLSLPPDPDCVPAALRFLSELLRLRIRVRQSESGTSECVCVWDPSWLWRMALPSSPQDKPPQRFSSVRPCSVPPPFIPHPTPPNSFKHFGFLELSGKWISSFFEETILQRPSLACCASEFIFKSWLNFFIFIFLGQILREFKI